MPNRENALKWLKYAQHDMDIASHLNEIYRPYPTNTICLHSQQSVEKAYKAILAYHDVKIPKIHDIRKLQEETIKCEPNVSIDAKIADKITMFAVESRYPDRVFDFTEEDAKLGLKYAKQVLDKVEKALDLKYREEEIHMQDEKNKTPQAGQESDPGSFFASGNNEPSKNYQSLFSDGGQSEPPEKLYRAHYSLGHNLQSSERSYTFYAKNDDEALMKANKELDQKRKREGDKVKILSVEESLGRDANRTFFPEHHLEQPVGYLLFKQHGDEARPIPYNSETEIIEAYKRAINYVDSSGVTYIDVTDEALLQKLKDVNAQYAKESPISASERKEELLQKLKDVLPDAGIASEKLGEANRKEMGKDSVPLEQNKPSTEPQEKSTVEPTSQKVEPTSQEPTEQPVGYLLFEPPEGYSPFKEAYYSEAELIEDYIYSQIPVTISAPPNVTEAADKALKAYIAFPEAVRQEITAGVPLEQNKPSAEPQEKSAVEPTSQKVEPTSQKPTEQPVGYLLYLQSGKEIPYYSEDAIIEAYKNEIDKHGIGVTHVGVAYKSLQEKLDKMESDGMNKRSVPLEQNKPSAEPQQKSAVQELKEILNSNGKKEDAANLTRLTDQIETLEAYMQLCESAIKDMKLQLETIKEIQNSPLKDSLEKTVKVLQKNVDETKGVIATIKDAITNGCKDAVAAFKERGITALDKLTSFFNVKGHYEKIEAKADKAIASGEKAINRIESFSREYHKGTNAFKNMARLIVGKEPINKEVEVGKLAKLISAPYRNQVEHYTGVKAAARDSINAIEKLEHRAENIREQRAEKKAAKTPSFKERMASAKDRAAAQNKQNKGQDAIQNKKDER